MEELTMNSGGEQSLFWMMVRHQTADLDAQELAQALPDMSLLLDDLVEQYQASRSSGKPTGMSGPGLTPGPGEAPETVASATVKHICHILRAVGPAVSENDRDLALKQLVNMSLDVACPLEIVEDVLESVVELLRASPFKVLQLYASRLCFYCEAQSDPGMAMRDQVVQVPAMMRALEFFTRRLFRGRKDDLCVQFLYVDLSLVQSGTAKGFQEKLPQKDLNTLLCERPEYPHVAQLLNTCLVSRVWNSRFHAYATLANVALYAKEHKGRRAMDLLLRKRVSERDLRLRSVLAALAWEVVFCDPELQVQHLHPEHAADGYCLLDDLCTGTGQVRLVAIHSIARLLFHQWAVPGADTAAAHLGGRQLDNEQHQDEDEEPTLEQGPGPAEHALLRAALIHTGLSRSNSSVRTPHEELNHRAAQALQTLITQLQAAAARSHAPMANAAAGTGAAAGQPAPTGGGCSVSAVQGLIARTVELAVRHGLNNGALRTALQLFPAGTAGAAADSGVGTQHSAPLWYHTIGTTSNHHNCLDCNCQAAFFRQGVGVNRGPQGSGRGGTGSGGNGKGQEAFAEVVEDSDDNSEPDAMLLSPVSREPQERGGVGPGQGMERGGRGGEGRGGGAASEGGLVAGVVSVDALHYAKTVNTLVQMLGEHSLLLGQVKEAAEALVACCGPPMPLQNVHANSGGSAVNAELVVQWLMSGGSPHA